MIYRLLLVAFLAYVSPVSAEKRTVVLNGFLGVESGETFSYRMVLTDSAGVLSGYAMTYARESEDSRSAVSGTVDYDSRSLRFSETRILHNNGFKSRAVICLLQGRLQQRQEGNGFVLAGPVRTADAGSAQCSRGTLRFEHESEIDALFARPVKLPDTVRRPEPARVIVNLVERAGRVQAASAAAPAKAVVLKDEITAGRDKEYRWYSDTVGLAIWDGGTVDGDIVSLHVNDRPVLSRYRLVKEKKQLKFPLAPGGTLVISIKAENAGNEPPNTADILLSGITESGEKVTYTVVAHNEAGREARILIRRAGTD